MTLAQPESGGENGQLRVPRAPATIDETGLGESFLVTLLIKWMYAGGCERPSELCDSLKLPPRVIQGLLQLTRDRGLILAREADTFSGAGELSFALTEKGQSQAIDALKFSAYVGAAPVTLDEYVAQAASQSITAERVSPETLSHCFESVVVPEGLLEEFGSAVNNAHSMLLYGPPGNGKTIFAELLVKAFSHAIYIPHAIQVERQIIEIFDPATHDEIAGEHAGASDSESPVDPRWVSCRRPIVIAGGELTLEMLELIFDPYVNVYQAPLQLKANGGIFIVDDFGRQAVAPERILNRWIVPLERKRDYLALRSAKKFPVPFDVLLVFSTNLDPRDFMDAAMMRRVHYKIEIGAPSWDEYQEIMRRECEARDVPLPDDVLPYLRDEFYGKLDLPTARYHPAWILDQAVSACAYAGEPARLDRELAGSAVKHLYLGASEKPRVVE
jgi:hypothetical protein